MPGISPAKRLNGQTALVTGASRGIGRGIALRLAAEGARVVLAARDEDALTAVAEEIGRNGGDALPVAADLTEESAVARVFERIAAWADPLDILVNNASRVYGTDRHFLAIEPALWDDVIDANLRTLFLCTSLAARSMADRRSGAIVNISAASATRAHRMCVPYDASKGAVEAFTRAVALDLAPFGVRVNAIAPGAIVVEAWGELPDEELEKRAEVIPLGRLGEPSDIAAAVAFLCSDDASYVTGQVLAVEGGLLAQLRAPQVENWEPGVEWPTP
ncbi:MAG TPA: glucose 1-dehydrogenase [Candidatus Limnocylindrales bacterium]